MAETMQTFKKRIRRDYTPLSIAVSIVNKNPLGSPMTQVFTERTNSYEPNHTGTPLVLGLDVNLRAKDGKTVTTYTNKNFGNMKWLLNGKDITTLADWKACSDGSTVDGDYYICKDGDRRGQIYIYKNFTAGWRGDLIFEGTIADRRLGTNIIITTDPVSIGCDNSSEDKYSMDLGEDAAMRYNPFADSLALYNYEKAHGYTLSANDKAKAETDINNYRRTIPIYVYQGGTQITQDYTIKVYRVSNVGTVTEIGNTAIDNEIIDLTPTAITFDLRLVENENYLIEAIKGGKVVASHQASVTRQYPTYRLEPLNGAAIPPEAEYRISEAQCMSEGSIVENPERVLEIQWVTDTANKIGVKHNIGQKAKIMLEDTGIGVTYEDDWIDMYLESAQKPAYNVATDSDGTIFTDELGTPYIFN